MSRMGFGVPDRPVRPYVAGRYYSWRDTDQPGTGSVGSATITRFRPVYLDASATIASLLFRITTLFNGGNAKFAIYAADPLTLAPTGNPLYASANQSTSATGIFEIASVNLALSSGWYVVAVQIDNATAILQGFNSVSAFFAVAAGADTAAAAIQQSNQHLGWQKTGTTYGTFPTLTGSLTTDSLTSTANSVYTGFKAG